MSHYPNKAEKIARIATLATLLFMICWGAVSVFTEIRPFWVDEWRVIYNLKFRSQAALWGPLDFLQQFPRVYLSLIKAFTQTFNYSYWSLRLPSYLLGTATILFCYRLMNKIYPDGRLNRFLFVMILISCSTFTEYFVQTKQYTMDMLLSLVAVWQLIALTELKDAGRPSAIYYALLCISFFALPFFSYTYPITVAPIYLVVLVQNIFMFRNRDNTDGKRKVLLRQWAPLFICTFSVTIFYFIDVAQLTKDAGMHAFWGHLMMHKGFDWRTFFINFYMLFAQIGAGFVYWLLFGILGICAFLFGLYKCYINLKIAYIGKETLLTLYSSALLVLVIAMFAAGQLPLGEPRLNAFTIPAVSILIIQLLDLLNHDGLRARIASTLSVVLLAGLIGNIYTTFIASISGAEYAKKMNIYRSTEKAIQLAQSKQVPVLITPGLAYPYDKTPNLPFSNTVPGDWVLKTFPAYNVADHLPVYAIDTLSKLDIYMQQLPADVHAVVAGDGLNYKLVLKP